MEYLKFGGIDNLDELGKEAENKNITEAIESIDIKIGDKIMSRFTGKEGIVTGILASGGIEVKFKDGNKQNISIESLFKIKGGKAESKLVNGIPTPYGDVDPLKKGNKDIENIETEVPEFKVLSPKKTETPMQDPKDKEVKVV
jgi:hypothetical protein